MRKFIGVLVASFLIFITIFALIMYSRHQNNQKIEEYGYAMDTLFNQLGYGTNCEDGFSVAMDKITFLDEKISRFNPESEVALINQNAGSWVNVSEDTFQLLKRAVDLCDKSGGVFDITLGAVIDLWDITGESPSVPSDEELSAALTTVSYKNIEFDQNNLAVRLTNEGTIIDLGGLAKGYATDAAGEIYLGFNVNSALISANSSIYTCGLKPGNEQYVLGVRDPRGTANEFIGTIKVQDAYVGSSGDYERYFEQDGIRYHHIFDPNTGKPADNGVIGITVVTDNGTEADFLSTFLFVMGIDYVKEHINEYQLIAVDADYNIYVSDSLSDAFSFDGESGYTLANEGVK